MVALEARVRPAFGPTPIARESVGKAFMPLPAVPLLPLLEVGVLVKLDPDAVPLRFTGLPPGDALLLLLPPPPPIPPLVEEET